jgi:hypothetical protein
VITAARKETRAEYEDRRDELAAMVGALQEAKQIIQQLKATGFLQMNSEVLTQIKAHHNKFLSRFPKQRSFHGLINLLMVTMQDKDIQADQSSVGKIVAIIDGLVESVFEIQKQEMIADDNRQMEFEMQKARLQLLNRRLQGSIADLNAKVQILTQRILELENDIATSNTTVEVKTSEKNDWLRTCGDAKNSFDQMAAIRKEQLEVIAECIEIFETRIINVQSFLETLHVQ